MTLYITRRKVGKLYHYFSDDERPDDAQQIKRINALAIPPAWRNVTISRGVSSKVQARGYDAAGRLQAIYIPTYR